MLYALRAQCAPNMLDVLCVLNVLKDASLACWALFLGFSEYSHSDVPDVPRPKSVLVNTICFRNAVEF